MSKSMYLHQYKEFESLLETISNQLDIEPQLIEKDYWLMHCLYGLKQSGLEFEMKGGTSLSKGHKIIKRFSEDIDIKIFPPAGSKINTDKASTSKEQTRLRKEFFDELPGKINIDGIVSVERDSNFDDPTGQDRNIGIRLNYNSHYTQLAGVKEGILLEIGFDATTPNDKMTISSWAYDFATAQNVPVIDNRAKDVICYHPGYTLVEKLQAVSTKYRQQQEKGEFPINFIRHYYDIYHLLNHQIVMDFIGTDNYYVWKDLRFRGADNKDIKTNEAFHLTDPEVRKLYNDAYQKSVNLYYEGQVPFEDILIRIKNNIDNL